MKKTLVLALCATMALTACGGGASAGDSQAKGDSKQKLVLSTFGLSEDISTEEVYAPFEQGLTVRFSPRPAGPTTATLSCPRTARPLST